mmetsp:Transcript_13616/g.47042  ORF Transcript_13616/g.47042 Transcript_13616/m.47042 type:complete len:217 (+) Transcript_13616:986-1636(+)
MDGSKRFLSPPPPVLMCTFTFPLSTPFFTLSYRLGRTRRASHLATLRPTLPITVAGAPSRKRNLSTSASILSLTSSDAKNSSNSLAKDANIAWASSLVIWRPPPPPLPPPPATPVASYRARLPGSDRVSYARATARNLRSASGPAPALSGCHLREPRRYAFRIASSLAPRPTPRTSYRSEESGSASGGSAAAESNAHRASTHTTAAAASARRPIAP